MYDLGHQLQASGVCYLNVNSLVSCKVFRRVRKTAESDRTSSCLSVRMEQLVSHWADLHEI